VVGGGTWREVIDDSVVVVPGGTAGSASAVGRSCER